MSSSSYVHGASQICLLGETIGQNFDRMAAAFADKEALVVSTQGIRWTYAQVKVRVDSFARGLVSLGLEPGDRIGIWAPNCAEWVVTQFASAKAGLILVNINPAYRLQELEFALNRAGCAALVTAASFHGTDYLQMLRDLAPEIDRCRPGELAALRLPSLRLVVQLGGQPVPGVFDFAQVASLGGANEQRRLSEIAGEAQFDEPINIQFTSGTTGTPKAATLTHHNVLNNAFFSGRAMGFTERDRLCIPVPLYHCFGMVLGNLTCVTHGATMVYPSASFDAQAVLRTVEAEHCTAVHGVPTMFIAEVDHRDLSRFDLSSLRTGIIAGAPCPAELVKRITAEMHLPELTIAYGMTETGPVSFQTAFDDSSDRRFDTVGRVLPHTEAKVVDRQGRVVPSGTPGELLTRGYGVMLGYWEDPGRTREAIDEAGWMHTGDLATLDEEGYCRIVGRLKDMVIRGGENIFPREIEEFLFQNPKVEDVQVIGVPDAKYGEELCAWIKLREGQSATEEEIRAFCRGRIAHFKVPRYIRFVTGFPMTVTGKIQKFAMRQTMAKELGDNPPPQEPASRPGAPAGGDSA